MASSEKVLIIDLNKDPENQRLLAGKPQTCGMRSGRVYLAPGKSCGQHSTKDREELLAKITATRSDRAKFPTSPRKRPMMSVIPVQNRLSMSIVLPQ